MGLGDGIRGAVMGPVGERGWVCTDHRFPPTADYTLPFTANPQTTDPTLPFTIYKKITVNYEHKH